MPLHTCAHNGIKTDFEFQGSLLWRARDVFRGLRDRKVVRRKTVQSLVDARTKLVTAINHPLIDTGWVTSGLSKFGLSYCLFQIICIFAPQLQLFVIRISGLLAQSIVV